MKRLDLRVGMIGAMPLVVALMWAGTAVAGEPAPVETTVPVDTTVPVGIVDGVEVAVGTPPVVLVAEAPSAPFAAVQVAVTVVDGVEVGVVEPPLPPQAVDVAEPPAPPAPPTTLEIIVEPLPEPLGPAPVAANPTVGLVLAAWG